MSGKQEIGISELAQMLGITPEAIRKYEAKGIVQVKRDESNKYRKYTAWEVMAMLHARRFSQIGFTLSQTADLLRTADDRAYIESIEMLQMQLAKEVARKRKLIMMLENKKKERCGLLIQQERIQIERLDEMFYYKIMDCSEQGASIPERNNAEEWGDWMDILPFTSEYLVFSRKDWSVYSTGFAISKSDAALYGFDNLKATAIIPESICATCILKGDYDELIVVRKTEEALRQVESMGYRVTGNIVAELFDYAKVDGKYEALHKCYFPIEI